MSLQHGNLKNLCWGSVVTTEFNQETAVACDKRFCSSSVSRIRRTDSSSKSLVVTNLEKWLIKQERKDVKPICDISGLRLSHFTLPRDPEIKKFTQQKARSQSGLRKIN